MGRKAVFCLLYFLAVVFTGLLLAAAVLSWRASFVSPEQGGFWATIALLLPVVLLANLAALVWWLIRRRWIVALMPLAALLLNMGYVSSMIQLPDFNAPAGSHDIRIATLNVNGFRQLGPKSITAAAVAEMMRHEQVGAQVVVAGIGKPDVFAVEDRIAADDGSVALGNEIGHPARKECADAVGRELAVVEKLLQT